MTAFQIESFAEQDINGQAKNLGAVTALRDGGFAVLLRSPGDEEVVTFGRTNDGGAQRIGGDVPLAVALDANLVPRADGGFAVIDTAFNESDPNSTINTFHAFNALGVSLRTYSFTGLVVIVGLDLTLDPRLPETWGVKFTNGVQSLVQLDPITLIPSDPLVEVLGELPNARLFFDGGFLFRVGFTRGEIRQAEALRPGTADALPSYFDPAGAFFNNLTAAGNQIVQAATVGSLNPDGVSLDTSLILQHYNPDGGAPVTVFNQVVSSALNASALATVTEVPGIGYGVLLTTFGSANVIVRAEVRLFEFGGVELGRQTMEGMAGQRTGNFQFKALVDPDHQTVRLLAVWTPFDLVNGSMVGRPVMAEIGVIDPLDGQFTVGTDYGDYLARLDLPDDLFGGAGGDVLDGFGGDDFLFGDAGEDVARGGAGLDSITGDEGNDALSGGDGNDILAGGEGDDVVKGDAGRDLLSGGGRATTLSLADRTGTRLQATGTTT